MKAVISCKARLLPASLLALAVSLASCDHKELCFDHLDHARRYSVEYNIAWALDWQYTYPEATDWAAAWEQHDFGMSYNDMRPTKPEGVRVQVYTDGLDNEHNNIGPDGGVVEMTPGTHQILFYNNDTEYILFNDLNSSMEASATTRARTRSTYIGNPYAGGPSIENGNTRAEETVNPPDFLFGHYIDDYEAEKTLTPPQVDITMKPLVFRYLVRYHFDHGLQYVGIARGALAGVAGNVFLTDGHTGNSVVTVLYDCELKPWGIEAKVNTFGAPNYPNPEYSRAEGDYGLNLEVRLTNGKLLNFDFDITEQMRLQPRGGVIEVGGINIPDEIGKEDSGSFDVNVDGWGEYEDINIGLGNKKN